MVYKPSKDNTVVDGLSWWAYPAGLADDTNFHGSDAQGGVEEEVEDVNEEEDEDEVVVLRDVGCAPMRVGAALWAAAASAAATARRMEGISPGCGWQAAGWRGPTVTGRPSGPIRSAAVGRGGGARGCGLRLSGSAGLGSCNERQRAVRRPRGGTVRLGCIRGPKGMGPRVSGVCVGDVCGSLGGLGVPWGVGLFAAGVCGLPGWGGVEGRSAGGSVAGVCA